MSVHPRLASLVLAALLLTSCGDGGSGGGDGAAGKDGGGLGQGAQNAGTTLVPEPTTVWVGSAEASALLKISPTSGAVERTDVNEGPWRLDYVDGSVWVRTPQVQRIDPATGAASDVLPEDVYVHDFLVDGDGIWASLRDEPKLVRYDVATGTPEEEVKLPSEDLNLEKMILRDGYLLAANFWDGTAVKIDLETGEVAARYDPDSVIWDLQLVDDSLWVAHYDGLVELDADTLEVRQTVDGVDAAYALDVDESGQLWVGLDDSVGTINDSGQVERAGNNVDADSGGGRIEDIKVSEESVWVAHGDVGLVRLDRATGALDEPIKIPGVGAFAPGFQLALQ
jgi:glutamine cyclotransferase